MSRFSRKQVQAALLCYAAFLLYATLWPFDFHFVAGFAAPRKISWIPFFDPAGGTSRKDLVMNVLVFLPFGALSFLVNAASAKIRRPVLIATLLGGALSLFVEVAQIWLPSRNPSTSDLLMNVVGALLGALSARSLERRFRSDPEGFRRFLRRNAVPILAIIYALSLLASTVRTFDPILNWRVLRIRAMAFAASPLLPDHLDLDYTAWMVLSFGFLSFLVSEMFAGRSAYWPRPFGYACAFLTCSLSVIALEAMQILFRSRHPLLNHALLGMAGVVYGMAWHRFLRERTGKFPVLPFFFHYALLLLLAFLVPFPHSVGSFRFDPRGLIPLYFHLQDISLPSLYFAVKTVVLYIPMGVLSCCSPAVPLYRYWRIPVFVACGLHAAIETFRGFSGTVFPDPTNILLAGSGACIGAFILRHAYKESTAKEPVCKMI